MTRNRDFVILIIKFNYIIHDDRVRETTLNKKKCNFFKFKVILPSLA